MIIEKLKEVESEMTKMSMFLSPDGDMNLRHEFNDMEEKYEEFKKSYKEILGKLLKETK